MDLKIVQLVRTKKIKKNTPERFVRPPPPRRRRTTEQHVFFTEYFVEDKMLF